MKISRVSSTGDYTIQVEFEDGVQGLVNLADLVKTGIFNVLKDENQFARVHTTGYSIAWSDDLEIDAATIYAELTGKAPSDYFSHGTYATN
jgi:high-affinity K+ transport system ATPase subunit B